jgi:hypothetical protein
MSAAHRRAAHREEQAANLLRTKRVKHRPTFVAMPDLEPIRFENGTVLQPEVVTRAKLPALLKKKIAQALRYTPYAVPLVVISERGGQPYAFLPLIRFAELVGLREPHDGEQLLLLGAPNGK